METATKQREYGIYSNDPDDDNALLGWVVTTDAEQAIRTWIQTGNVAGRHNFEFVRFVPDNDLGESDPNGVLAVVRIGDREFEVAAERRS